MRAILAALCFVLVLGCNKASTEMDDTLGEIERFTRDLLTRAETGAQISPSEFNTLIGEQREFYTKFSQLLQNGIRLTARQQKKGEEIDALNKSLKRVEYSSKTQRVTLYLPVPK